MAKGQSFKTMTMTLSIATESSCRGSRSGTTANKINPYYLIGLIFFIYLFSYTNLSVAKYRWYISVQG